MNCFVWNLVCVKYMFSVSLAAEKRSGRRWVLFLSLSLCWHINLLRLLNKFCAVSLKCYFCVFRSRQSTKRKAPDTVEESPTKRFSPPKKSQSVRCKTLTLGLRNENHWDIYILKMLLFFVCFFNQLLFCFWCTGNQTQHEILPPHCAEESAANDDSKFPRPDCCYQVFH